MAVGVFPALKLGVLLIKQISKPLAKLLINQAKSHPVFRPFISYPGQWYHWAEIKTKMYIMNLGKATKVSKLNEEMAIELGANLMGEIIIFSIGGGCLLFEYSRQQAKETKKEMLREQQLEKFTSDIQGLFETVTQQESEIRFLNAVIEELNKKAKCKLPSKNSFVTNNNLKTETETNNNVNSNSENKLNIVETAIKVVEKKDETKVDKKEDKEEKTS